MYHRRKDEYTYAACVAVLKLLILPILLIYWIVRWIYRRSKERRYEKQIYEMEAFSKSIEDDELEHEMQSINDTPDLPDMCQVFPLGDGTLLGIQHVSLCPDETAHIRIIGDTTFSQIYKRKVYYDKNNDRYITISNQKYYLDLLKTKPVDPIQSKEGK